MRFLLFLRMLSRFEIRYAVASYTVARFRQLGKQKKVRLRYSVSSVIADKAYDKAYDKVFWPPVYGGGPSSDAQQVEWCKPCDGVQTGVDSEEWDAVNNGCSGNQQSRQGQRGPRFAEPDR